jgi:uncharacterized protein
MQIWVDADACPVAIKEIICKAALKHFVRAVFVANKEIRLVSSPWLSSVKTAMGADIADQYIVTHSSAGDLTISQDIPLAAQLLEKGVQVISPYGILFTTGNIGERLANRNFLQDMRDAGLITGGPAPFGEKEKRLFANVFDRTLNQLLTDQH